MTLTLRQSACSPSSDPLETTLSYCYSIDGGEIYERADSDTVEGTPAEAAETVLLDGCGVPGQPFTVYVAIPRTAAEILRGGRHRQAIGESVVEAIDGELSYHIGSEDPLCELSAEQAIDLGELVIAFLEKAGALNAWTGVSEKAHTITVPTLPGGGA